MINSRATRSDIPKNEFLPSPGDVGTFRHHMGRIEVPPPTTTPDRHFLPLAHNNSEVLLADYPASRDVFVQ